MPTLSKINELVVRWCEKEYRIGVSVYKLFVKAVTFEY